ncbi:MAG: hypothetical protein WCD70_14370 [Alphaproteobacteria bacterium]
MAASVPRFLRQARVGYLPSTCVIGSRLLKGDGGVNLYYDIIMLPEPEFVRMKSNIGLQHVIAPGPKMGPTFSPMFVLKDTKHVTVPADELDPVNYAKSHFMIAFGLMTPDSPQGSVS